MALSKQNIDVLLNAGLDTKSDDFSVISSRLQALTNGKFVDKTSVATRPGHRPLITGGEIASVSPSGVKRIHARGDEVILESDVGLHVAAQSKNHYKVVNDASNGAPASLNRCLLEIEGVDHSLHAVLEADVAYLTAQDLTCVVYTVAPTQQYATIGAREVWCRISQGTVEIYRARIDAATVTSVALAGAFFPRVVATDGAVGGDFFHIYWVENVETGGLADHGLWHRTFNGTALTMGSSSRFIGSLETPKGGANYDVAWQPHEKTGHGTVFLALTQELLIYIDKVQMFNLNPVDGYTPINSGIVSPDGNPIKRLRCVAPPNPTPAGNGSYVVVAQTTANTGGFVIVVDLDVSAAAAVSSVGTGGFGVTISPIAILVDPITPGVVWAAWEASLSGSLTAEVGTDQTMIMATTFSVSGSTPAYTLLRATQVVRRGLGISTDMWEQNGRVFIGAFRYDSTSTTWFAAQMGLCAAGTSFTSSLKTEVCARVNMQSAFASIQHNVQSELANGGPGIHEHMPSKVSARGGKVIAAVLRGDDDLVSYALAGANASPVGLDIFSFDYSAQLNSITVDSGLVMAGANPHYFDGAQLSELGFEYYPAPVRLAAGGTAGSGPAGVYRVLIVYEWTDKNGIKFQSAPSVPAAITLGAAGTISVTLPTLQLTRKDHVGIACYMTAKDGSLYYRVMLNRQGTIANNPNTSLITADDLDPGQDLAAGVIELGELTYVTGGALANMPFPACKHVDSHQDRIMFTGCEQSNRLLHTEERQSTFFPGYNPVYTLEADSGGGRVVATQSIDDKLVVFQERQISGVFGRGPNRLGLDNNFSNPARIVTGYGMVWDDSNVVVQDMSGVWFKDQVGLRHLDRALQISKVQINENGTLDAGAEVDNLITAGHLFGAARSDDTKQIYFANGTGGLLVWDYQFQQWSLYTDVNNTAVVSDVCSAGAQLLFFQFGDVLWCEDPTLAYDKNASGAGTLAIPLSLTTSWIRTGQLQGFQRLYNFLLLLQDVPQSSTHTLAVSYDFNVLSTQTLGLAYDTVAAGTAKSSVSTRWDLLSVGDQVIWPDSTRSTVTGFSTTSGPVYNLLTDGSFTDAAPGVVTLDKRLGLAPSTKTTTFPKYAVPRLQIENKVSKQKCESIQVTYTHSSTGGGVRCSGMTLQLGVKKGTFKLPSSHRVT